MSTWYTTGTIAVTNGGSTVTGTGTAWAGSIRVGDALHAPDGKVYEVSGIASDTSLTIAPAYLGATASGQDYRIQPTRGVTVEFNNNALALLAQVQGYIDGPLAGLFGSGSAGTPALSFAADTDTGLYRDAANALGFAAGGTRRALLTTTAFSVDAGVDFRLGGFGGVAVLGVVGESGKTTAQFVQGGDTTAERTILAQATGGQNFGAYVDAVSVRHLVSGVDDILTSNGNFLAFHSGGGVEALRVDANQRIVAGTDTAFSAASGTADGMTFNPVGNLTLSRDNSVPLSLRRRTGDGTIANFYRDTAEVGSISVTTTSTSYNTSSDYRLKENVAPITGALDRLAAMQPRRFNFIADPGVTVDGFIAHELSTVVPEAVTGEKDAMRIEEYEVTPAEYDAEGNVVTPAVMGTREVPDYQGVDQSKLTPILTAALQEAVAKIDALEARVAVLEGAA